MRRRLIWGVLPLVFLVVLFSILVPREREEQLAMWSDISEKTDVICDDLHEEQKEELDRYLPDVFALLPAGESQIQLEYSVFGGWKEYRSDYESVAYSFADEALEGFLRSLFENYHVQRIKIAPDRVTIKVWNDTLFYTDEPVEAHETIEVFGDGWYHFSYPYEDYV